MSDTLHTIFLLDTSASMFGIPIEALKERYTLLSRIMQPLFESNAKNWFITGVVFDSEPRFVIERCSMFQRSLVDLPTLPALEVGGISNLGKACQFVREYLDQPSRDTAVWILLFSDGVFSDDWETGIDQLQFARWFDIYCGSQPNPNSLKPFPSEDIDFSRTHDHAALSNKLQSCL